MKDSLRTIAFAAVLAIVCAGLLTAANRLLADFQQANEQAERWRNIFEVLDLTLGPDDGRAVAEARLGAKASPEALAAEAAGVRTPEDLTAEELVGIANRKIREREVGELTVFEYRHPEAGPLRAVEFAGPGLWGPVEGLLCLKADLETVFRISFYKHEETPGLGGEIGSEAFRGRFGGRKITVPGAEPGIRVVRVRTGADNEVDAISGATMTCEKVTAMLQEVSRKIVAHRQEILGEDAHGK